MCVPVSRCAAPQCRHILRERQTAVVERYQEGLSHHFQPPTSLQTAGFGSSRTDKQGWYGGHPHVFSQPQLGM